VLQANAFADAAAADDGEGLSGIEIEIAID
jgi:hypothetical protein